MKELKDLYNELLHLVNTKNFRVYGFAKTGNHYNWMKRVNHLKKTLTGKEKEVVTNLAVLSVYYVSNLSATYKKAIENNLDTIAELRLQIENEL